MRVTSLVIIFTAALASVMSTTVLGCTVQGTGTHYTSVQGSGKNFHFGQSSQGGNYYYGVAGQLSTTFPPDPRYDSYHSDQHVNGVMGADDVNAAAGCCWVYVGWVVGASKLGGTGVAKRFAETSTAQGVTQSLEGATAPASAWYSVHQTGYDSATGQYLWTAYRNDAGTWSPMLSGELASPNALQSAFGEATDPQDIFNDQQQLLSHGYCLKESQPSSSRNVYASLQLLLADLVTWNNWEPAFGRWADMKPDNGYTATSTRNFTDMQVGGCNGCP
jgi:hypothetical protein